MKKALASVFTSFVLLIFSCLSARAEVRTGKGLSPVLDGQVYIVAVAPLNGQAGGYPGSSILLSSEKEPDLRSDRSVITFSGGRFHPDSSGCSGCRDGIYRATVVGDSISFEAETSGISGERVVWRGTVRGADLFGTAVRTTPEGGRIDYTFYGRAGE